MIYHKFNKLVKIFTCILLLSSVTIVTAKDIVVKVSNIELAGEIVEATINNYYHYITGLFGVLYAFYIINKNVAVPKTEVNFNSK